MPLVRCSIFGLLILVSLLSSAQISGVLKDAETGKVIEGASILGPNSEHSISDFNGEFSIAIENDSLLISHVNFVTQKFFVTSGFILVRMRAKSRVLNEVTINGFITGRPLSKVPSAVSKITHQTLSSFDETSIVTAVNSVPGVRMEQRSPGSYRINIRGSSLRAPFDVRNVKVYWNGIIFTEPGGNTPFNLLDASNFDEIEIIKGPNGSIYGAGLGGVVIASNHPESNRTIETGLTIGSYGLSRFTANINVGNTQNRWLLNYSIQESDGYRDHTSFKRESLQLSTRFKQWEKSSLSADVLYSYLNYQIPGGLTKDQYDANPRQARPGNPFVQGSVESNASIDVENFLVGITHDQEWNGNLSTSTTLYTVITDFENPFNFDYKREAQLGAGGRSTTKYSGAIGDRPFILVAGVEYQTRFAAARNFENNLGAVGVLNFDDELRTKQAMAFIQTNFELPMGFSVGLGLSLNKTSYDINRLIDVALDSSFRVRRHFSTIVVPRVGLTKSLGKMASMYVSISTGFSPPTLEEVRTNEGSINGSLNPEKGNNYEIGIRGAIIDSKLDIDVSLFHLKLKESIVDLTDDRGTDIFQNAGKIDQDGIELLLRYRLIDKPENGLSLMTLQTSYTLQKFKFDNYVSDGDDFSGKALPGAANNTVVTTLNLLHKIGLYVNVIHNFTDRIPLNNENTVFSESYNLLNFKLGFKFREIVDKLNMNVFVGANNFLNQQYSLGNDLNAFGGRYFQPSPDRNFYAGLKLKYRLE